MKVETLIRGDVRVVKSYSLLLTYMYLAVNLIGFLDKILKVELVTKADLDNGGGLKIFSDQSNILEVGGDVV